MELYLCQKIYETALEVIELVQETYKFKSEMDSDPEFEKYVKFIGTFVYNESLKVGSGGGWGVVK